MISKLFLYRYRFFIGFSILTLASVALLFSLPLLAPAGLSEAEMISAAESYSLDLNAIMSGDIVNLPYRLLQKLSITLFGLSIYSVKLPSIIIGLLLGWLLILLLNRWFKTNVALAASILAVLSSSFLFISGSGTPLIMLVFWPTLLLWLGSCIQGVTKPNPFYCFVFAFALLGSIFTPHLIYLAIFIVLFAFLNPHLRFTIKTLPVLPLVLTALVILAGLTALIITCIVHPTVAAQLFLTENLSFSQFFANLGSAFAPFFTWNSTLENPLLSPQINLACVALAVVGLLSTTRGFFASRNSIASCFIIFTVILSGLNPSSAVLILLPAAILIAHGLRYILDKWYNLFPDNPYARISALLPIGVFLAIMIITDVSHFIFGYRYIPVVADHFNNDISLINENLAPEDTLYVISSEAEQNFYQILEDQHKINLETARPETWPTNFAVLHHESDVPGEITRIITSPKADNSDRIYLYSNQVTEETE